MKYELLLEKIQNLLTQQYYVFPRVYVQNSLDELQEARTNPYYYWLNEDKKLEYLSTIEEIPRLLLLSDPGFGKSEFLRQYAVYLAEGFDQSNILPLYVELKGYRPNLSLEKYIEQQIKIRFGIEEPLLALKKKHRLAFLLDGFDETGNSDLGSIVDAVKLFLLSYENHQAIISSRLHFYLRYRPLEDHVFSILHITAFTNDGIREYLQNNGLDERDIDRVIIMFQEPDSSSTLPSFWSILSIPRYLEKYLELYKSGIKERITKAQIYDHFVESRLETEDEKYPGRALKEFYRNFLEKLALIMEIYQQNQISRSEFITILDQLESNLLQAVLSKIDSFEYLFEKNILVDYGGQISFEDRSLQEYLAACEMAKWDDQKKVYDLAVVEELQELNPSWVNTLSYYLDLDSSFLEYAVEFHHSLVLRSSIANLLPDQKSRIFQKVLTHYQQKMVWIEFDTARRIAQLYSETSRAEIEKYTCSSAHLVQKGNIAFLIGLISSVGNRQLQEYQEWLIHCANDDHPDGVLQRRALFGLGELGDTSVIGRTKEKALSHPDPSVREAFLDMCGQLDLEGTVPYFLNEFNRSSVSIIWLTKVKGREAITVILRRLIGDRSILEGLCVKRDRDLKQLFENIEAVYNEYVQDLLIQVIFTLLKIPQTFSGDIHRYVARLLKKKAPSNVWQQILIQALEDADIDLHTSGLLIFLSYFITDSNLYKFIEALREANRYEQKYGWITETLVHYVQVNEDNPASSIIEQKAREILPDYYKEVDEAREKVTGEPSRDKKRFVQWKQIFDELPYRYDSTQFQLFYWCLNEFDESFELDYCSKDKMGAIINGVLSEIDPRTFQITVSEWDDEAGGVRSFSQTRGQTLYEKALKLNFSLNLGFCDRKKLISFLRVLHSTEKELLQNILSSLGPLDSDETVEIKGFLQNKVYTAIRTYIEVVRSKQLHDCLDLLKEFANDEAIEYFYRTECLEAIEELTHDKQYLAEVLHSHTLDERMKGKAAYLLVTRHQDEEALRWQFDQLKEGLHPYDWREGHSTGWLAQVRTPNAVSLYIDLLEASYSLRLGQEERARLLGKTSLSGEDFEREVLDQERADWLFRIAVEGLKFQRNKESFEALRSFIDKNRDRIEGVNFLEYNFEEIKRDYLLYRGRPASIQDAVIRYNEMNRRISRKIPDEEALFDTIIEVFENQIRHYIEEEGGYRNFYRDRECSEPKTEPEIQHLLRIWRPYFQTLGIHLLQEEETGRGPVDYTFNYGFIPRIQKCCLEIKLSTHHGVPGGFEPQLYTYVEASRAKYAILLVVRIGKQNVPIPNDSGWMDWMEKITRKCEHLGKHAHIPIRSVFFDAIKKPSASNVRSINDVRH